MSQATVESVHIIGSFLCDPNEATKTGEVCEGECHAAIEAQLIESMVALSLRKSAKKKV
jgi:hypothetical protein